MAGVGPSSSQSFGHLAPAVATRSVSTKSKNQIQSQDILAMETKTMSAAHPVHGRGYNDVEKPVAENDKTHKTEPGMKGMVSEKIGWDRIFALNRLDGAAVEHGHLDLDRVTRGFHSV